MCVFQLHVFECDILCLREEKKHYDKLHNHHEGEEYKWKSTRSGRKNREEAGYNGVRHPVREATQALALGANAVGEYFADIDPDNWPQRK
jgi:hypothetical protein